MNSNAYIRAFLPETIVIGPSLTIGIPAIPTQIATVLKYGSGGSLLIQGSTLVIGTESYGSTYASVKQYLVTTGETVNVGEMAGGLTLSTVGATVTCYLLRGLNQVPGLI